MTVSREDLWRRRGFVILLFTFWLEISQSSQAAFPSPDETGEAARWAAANFGGVAEIPPESPFSFQYDGQALAELAWKPARSTRKLDARRTEHALRYADEPIGLEVRCVAVEYHDFPVVEWTVYFKNTGTGDTRILSDILALDARFHRTGGSEFVLHHNVGSLCTPNDFQPLETALQPGSSKRITAAGGRPSNSDWPYFNVAWPGAGVIVAVGWPGQWAAEFTADAGWYWCDGQWPKTGTWEVDTKRFPGGLRPISDHARAKGVKTIVWFEPERVHSGTWLTENHPQWIVGGKNGGLLNLGNPRVRQWLTEHVDKLLTEQGIDLYRQDFNIDPLSFWQKNDTACFDVRRKDLDYDLIRRVLGQWKQYARYYFGDYYPLTPYSLDQTAWIGWQFDVPEKGEGVVQAFRRAESVYEVARFKLRGLDPGAGYVFTNLDSGQPQTLSGRELLDQGLAVPITDQPGSAVITYKKR